MVHPDGRFYYRINNEVFNFSEEVLRHAGKEIEPSEEPYKTQWAEYNAQEYARARKEKYNALNQLELISDDAINGTTTHKNAIVAIKTAHPKPE
jgi:hypothetical protein